MDIEQIQKPLHGSLAWQQARHRSTDGKCVIGASEVSTIMGCNPYESLADIAIRKLMPAQTTETNDAMMRGNILEPALLQYAQNMLDTPLETPEVMYRNGHIIATLDGRGVEQTQLIVEVKTNNHWALGSELPDAWLWQAQAQMFCTETDEVHFAVLDKNMRLGMDIVQRNDYLIEQMLIHVEHFCTAIEAEQLPKDIVLTAPQVADLYPTAAGEVELDSSALNIIAEWEAIKDAMKDLELKEKLCKDALANMLLDNEFGTVSGQRVLSYKSQSAKRFDSKAFIADFPEYGNQYTTASTFRVLRTMK